MNVIGEAISRKWFTEFRTSHMNTDVYETSGSSKEAVTNPENYFG